MASAGGTLCAALGCRERDEGEENLDASKDRYCLCVFIASVVIVGVKLVCIIVQAKVCQSGSSSTTIAFCLVTDNSHYASVH